MSTEDNVAGALAGSSGGSGIFGGIASVLGSGLNKAGSVIGHAPTAPDAAPDNKKKKDIGQTVQSLVDAGTAGISPTAGGTPVAQPTTADVTAAVNPVAAPPTYPDADLGGNYGYADGDLKEDPAKKLQQAQNSAFDKIEQAQSLHHHIQKAQQVAYQQAMRDMAQEPSLLHTEGTSHQQPAGGGMTHVGRGGTFMVDPNGNGYYVAHDAPHRALEFLTNEKGRAGSAMGVPGTFNSGGGYQNYDFPVTRPVQEEIPATAPMRAPLQEVVSPLPPQPAFTGPPPQQVAADADLQEPSGEAHWTLREEDNYILAKNQRTGELRKLVTAPLSHQEQQQAEAPHGAGPLGAEDPNRQRMQMQDMDMKKKPISREEVFQSMMADKAASKEQEFTKGFQEKVAQKTKAKGKK